MGRLTEVGTLFFSLAAALAAGACIDDPERRSSAGAYEDDGEFSEIEDCEDGCAWIGAPCHDAPSTCDFEAGGQEASCLTYEEFGFCSIDCEGVCPDREGEAETFCVAVDGAGQCVVKAGPENADCADIPGTEARFASRHIGSSGASPRSARVCLPDDGQEPTDLAARLLELTSDANCQRLPGTSLFRTDAGRDRTIPICRLNGAIWWRADADIDCDGGRSSPCTDDPWYQPETSSKDSTGRFIDSANVPHFVVPMAGSGFTPTDFGIRTGWNARGTAGAILYNGQLLFAPYADAGPRHVVGELSAAAAEVLGIPNHPVSGGIPDGVTYIVFTDDIGVSNQVDPIESRDAANTLGEQLAEIVLQTN